jgi:hypothetical protein
MATAKLRHPWPIGTKVLSLRGEQDHDENDMPRTTGPRAWGTVIDREDLARNGQGWSYGLEFKSSGVLVRVDEADLDAFPEGYIVVVDEDVEEAT